MRGCCEYSANPGTVYSLLWTVSLDPIVSWKCSFAITFNPAIEHSDQSGTLVDHKPFFLFVLRGWVCILSSEPALKWTYRSALIKTRTSSGWLDYTLPFYSPLVPLLFSLLFFLLSLSRTNPPLRGFASSGLAGNGRWPVPNARAAVMLTVHIYRLVTDFTCSPDTIRAWIDEFHLHIFILDSFVEEERGGMTPYPPDSLCWFYKAQHFFDRSAFICWGSRQGLGYVCSMAFCS